MSEIKKKKLTGSQLLLESDTKASRHLKFIDSPKSNFIQLFEPKTVTQIKGIKLDFSPYSQLTRTGVKERQQQKAAGDKRRRGCKGAQIVALNHRKTAVLGIALHKK